MYCKRESPLARWTEGAPFAVNCEFDPDGAPLTDSGPLLQSLRKTLHSFQPDVLNPHCPPGHSFLALARALSPSNAPLVRTVADPRSPNSNFVNAFLHRRLTKGILFTSRSSLNRYSRLLWKSTVPVQVILPGFRADDFIAGVKPQGYRERFGVKPDQIFAGIIARMSPEKGQEVFLEALSKLGEADRKRIFCVMAGEDSRERGQAALQAIAKQHGVENQVAFLGKLDDVRRLMSELDLGIITSTRSEAICRVALEYMSFGIPILSSDVNILAEVVRDDVNGLSFPNQNSDAMAAKLQTLLNDTSLRDRLGQTGRSLVHGEFDIRQEIETTVAFFSQILSKQTSRGH